MFLYWVSSNIMNLDMNPVTTSRVDNIEYYLSKLLKTNTRLATTDELLYVHTPPVTKRYGLTRELCTAYFQNENSDSLTGGYNKITRMCQEKNLNAGLWIYTKDQLSEDFDTENIEIYGSVKQSNLKQNTPSKNIDKRVIMGVCVIISLIASGLVYRMYKHEPIFSLLTLITLILVSMVIIYN